MIDKIYKNALITENLSKLTSEEKRKIINKLLKNSSTRKLSAELCIPKSTIQLWKNPEVSYNKPVDFSGFYNKIKELDPKDIKDWGRLQQIRDRINILLSKKKL